MDRSSPDREQASRLVQTLLGRREFIVGSSGFMLALGGLSFEGCGGAGGGFGFGGTSRMVQVGGTIVLPTGFTVPATQLSVGAGVATSVVKTPNIFTAKISGAAPSFATVQDALGNGVLFGFLDPSKSSNVLDVNSTAAALIYFALGGYMLPAANTENILALIAGEPALAALAKVIAARLVADPLAMSNGDPQIGTALAACYAAVAPAAQPAVKSGPTGKSPLSTPSGDLLLQPSTETGGLELLQTNTPLEAQITNHYRRRCKAYVYKTGTQPSGGALQSFTKVESYLGPIDVPTVTAIGLVESIFDLFQGTSPLTPITVPPFSLPLDSGATKTLYEVVILGPAVNNADPECYSDSRYVDQVATFRATRTGQNIEALLIDLVFSIVLELLGVKAIIASTNAVQAAADAIAAVEDVEWQAALALAQAGQFGQGAINALTRIASSSLVRQDLVRALGPLLSAAQAATLSAASDAEVAALLKAGQAALLKVLAAAGILLGFGDIGAVLYSLDNADAGDLWTATSFVPAFALNPQTATVSPGTDVTFTIVPPPGISGNIEYDWTQNATNGTLSSSDGTVGNSLKTTSSDTKVTLITAPSDTGTVTVTVVAYQVAANGTKSEIGQTTAKVTLSANAGGSTGSVVVVKYDPIKGDNYFTAFAFATFPIVAGASQYVMMSGEIQVATLLKTDIDAGAPVVDIAADQDTSTLVPYNNGDGGTKKFYNLGGGLVGFMALPFTGTYQPISYQESVVSADQNAMTEFAYTVVVS